MPVPTNSTSTRGHHFRVCRRGCCRSCYSSLCGCAPVPNRGGRRSQTAWDSAARARCRTLFRPRQMLDAIGRQNALAHRAGLSNLAHRGAQNSLQSTWCSLDNRIRRCCAALHRQGAEAETRCLHPTDCGSYALRQAIARLGRHGGIFAPLCSLTSDYKQVRWSDSPIRLVGHLCNLGCRTAANRCA